MSPVRRSRHANWLPLRPTVTATFGVLLDLARETVYMSFTTQFDSLSHLLSRPLSCCCTIRSRAPPSDSQSLSTLPHTVFFFLDVSFTSFGCFFLLNFECFFFLCFECFVFLGFG
ncbi:uncharacterized protein DS421_9g266640 [Arachis hypogaea]|nr:uncharacterized protein DS421_9g266640 [Arachis hypogaea]